MCLVIGLNVIGEEQNTFTIFDNPEYFPEVGISKIEELKGITENVIVGSQIPIGSGTVDIYMKSVTKN